ncbi:MlaD family protein [Mycobacterium syngnathidarum]
MVYVGSMGVRFTVPDDRAKLSMTVHDINGMAPGSSVLYRGVLVGQVTKVASSSAGGVIEFYIEDGYKVSSNCDVRLDNLSALGEAYISLIPRGEGPAFKDGQKLTVRDVIQPPSISEFASHVVHTLQQMDPGQLSRIVGETDAALPDPDEVLPNLTRASSLLRATVDSIPGQGRVLLENFQSLLANAAFLGPELNSIGQVTGQSKETLYNFFFTAQEVLSSLENPNWGVLFKNFILRIDSLFKRHGGDLKVILDALQPQVSSIAATVMNVDMGQILGNILDAVPEDGSITLRVGVPQGG